MNLDWSELAFGSKKPLKDLHATFIAAPRQISGKRFGQLIKEYLPQGNIVLGVSKEPYVLGLENRPQFAMLTLGDVQDTIKKVNTSSSKHKIYTLAYSQRDIVYIYEKIPFMDVVLINGSWYHGFHHRPEYYALVNQGTPFSKVSPFSSEEEAKSYATKTTFAPLTTKGIFNETEVLALADQAASHSYDYAGYQTGGVLARMSGKGYKVIAASHNRIVPYETYAMHHGSERERHFSPVNDLNHYDTIHYEVALLVEAAQKGLDISGATMFETVLSCPHCTRMLAATDIAEVVYQQDHSDGYAVTLLEEAGKKVRRIV